MNKEQLKQMLEKDYIKRDKITHFRLKACEIVTEKYGGEPSEWYLSGSNPEERNDKNREEIYFNRILDNKIDKVLVTCKYNPGENRKVLSTYKSTISFKHIASIEVDPEKIIIKYSSRQFPYSHIRPFIIDDEPFEKFHKILIRKFDAYCDAEYNKLIE